MAMLGSQNPHRHNAPLAQRLRRDDLYAHLAPLDRYGPTGFGSAIAEGLRTFVGAWNSALRGAICCAGEGGPDCGLD
jgi:hypothetical protein